MVAASVTCLAGTSLFSAVGRRVVTCSSLFDAHQYGGTERRAHRARKDTAAEALREHLHCGSPRITRQISIARIGQESCGVHVAQEGSEGGAGEVAHHHEWVDDPGAVAGGGGEQDGDVPVDERKRGERDGGVTHKGLHTSLTLTRSASHANDATRSLPVTCLAPYLLRAAEPTTTGSLT